MDIIFTDEERDACTQRCRVGLNKTGLWLEVPEQLALWAAGPLSVKYHRGNEVHEFWVQPDEDASNAFGNKMYPGRRRRVNIKRESITGFTPDERRTLVFATGAPLQVTLHSNGRLNVQVPHAGPLRVTDCEKKLGQDFFTPVGAVQWHKRAPAAPQACAKPMNLYRAGMEISLPSLNEGSVPHVEQVYVYGHDPFEAEEALQQAARIKYGALADRVKLTTLSEVRALGSTLQTELA